MAFKKSGESEIIGKPIEVVKKDANKDSEVKDKDKKAKKEKK